MHAVLFVLLGALALAQAIQIVSRSPVLDVIDGVVQRTQNLEILCGASDFGQTASFTVTDSTGTNRLLSVTCSELQYIFALQLQGYVPRDGQLRLQEICLSRTSFIANASSVGALLMSNPALQANPGGNRRLLEWYDDMGDHLQCDFSIGTSCPRSGPSQEDLDKLQAQLNEFQGAANDRLNAISNFMNASSRWDAGILANAQATSRVQQSLMDAVAKTDARFNAGEAATAAVKVAVGRLALLTATKINQINTNMNDLRSFAANLSLTLQAQTYSEFNRSWLAMGQLEVDTKTAINDLSASVYSQFEDNYVKQRLLAKGIRNLASTISKFNLRSDTARAFSRLFLEDVVRIAAAGYQPFLYDLGTQPQDNGLVYTQKLETVSFSWVTSGSRAHHAEVSYVCNVRYMMDSNAGWYTWKDFLETMGPPGCNLDASVADTACQCHGEVVRSWCDLPPGGTLSANFTNGMTLDQSTCGSTPPTQQQPILTTNGTDFIVLMSAMCLEVGANMVYMGALMNGRFVNFTNSVGSCVASYQNLETPTDGVGITFGTLAFWEMAYMQWNSFSDVLARYYDGDLPAGLSFRDTPFQRRYGQTTTCTTGAMMSYSADFLPVYRLVPQRVVASVTATVEGVAGVTTSAATIDVAISNILPTGGDIVVGDPRSNSSIYNIPDASLSLNPLPQARENGVLYPLLPHTNNFTLAAWTDLYGVTFDHFSAANVAQLYATPVNPTTGACAGMQMGGSGAWCDRRASFSVRGVPGSSTEMMMVPRTSASFRSTVSVPEGDLTLKLTSLCPTLMNFSAGTGTVLTLMSAQTPGSVTRVRTTIGPEVCAAAFVDDLVGAAAIQRLVPHCAASGGLSTVTVQRLNGTGAWVDCVSNLDLTTGALRYVADLGNADLHYVSASSMNLTDNVASALTSIVVHFQDMMLSNTLAQLQMVRSTGLRIDNTSYADFLARANQTADVLKRIIDGFQLPQVTTDDIMAVKLKMEAEYGAAMAAAKTAREEFLNAMDNVKRDIDAQSVTLAEMNNSLVELEKARTVLFEAEKAFTGALVNITSTIVGVFGTLKRKGGFGSLFGIGDAFSELVDVAEGFAEPLIWLAENAPDKLLGFAQKLVDMAKDAVGSLFSGITGILIIIASAIGGLAGFLWSTKELMALAKKRKAAKMGADSEMAPMGTSGNAVVSFPDPVLKARVEALERQVLKLMALPRQ